MAQISLHDYLQQIDTLLEENRLSEAVAHCRHILKKFPRHVDTYRLYGKALLEQQKFDDAVDIFQRVLSADPEDFIAHVGLAITHKEKAEVPAAIWHFERAFEMDPYNAAIQDELGALYANRDGLRPERINLTRGALARLYFRGHLYRQAADELRSLLAQNGEKRLDLQTLLAETLWRDDQRVDVVDVCLRILDQTPFCIKANAILAEVWLVTGRSDEASEYLQRLRMLTRPEKTYIDPDSVVGRAFTANGVVDLPEKVFIDELDYIPGAQELQGDADWVSELSLEPEEIDEEANWLDEIEKVDAGVFAEAAATEADEDMLDWLREVADSDEPVQAEDSVSTIILGDLDQEAPQAEFESSQDEPFDWFAEETETSRESLADVPDWLSEVTASAEADMWNMAIEANEESQAESEVDDAIPDTVVGKAETPDWIRDVAHEAGPDPTLSWKEEDEESSSSSDIGATTVLDGGDEEFPAWDPAEDMADDLPDWLTGSGEAAAEEQASFTDWLNSEAGDDETVFEGDETLPDWLTGEGGESEQEFPDFSLEESVYGLTGEEIPDWLLGADEREETEESLEAEPGLEMDMAASEVEVPDFDNLDFAIEDSVEPTAESRFDLEPDTDFEATFSEDNEDPFAAVFEADDDELPAWLAEAQEDLDMEDSADLEDLPDWLKADTGLIDGETVSEEDSDGELDEETIDETADWLSEFEEAEQSDEALPDWLEDSPELVVGQTDIDHDTLPDWLGGEQEGTVREETLMGSSEEQENQEPDVPEDLDEAMKWLEELAAEQGADLAELPSLQQETGEQASIVSDDDVPDWLKGDLSDGELSGDDDLPDWLKQEAESMAGDDWLNLSGEDDLAELDFTSYDQIDSESEGAIQSDEDIPDWLKAQMPQELQEQESEPAAVEEDLSWLDQIAAGEGAPLEELPTLSWGEGQDDIGLDFEDSEPDWTDNVPEVDVVASQDTPHLSETVSEPADDAMTAVPDDPDEAMAWLESLAAQQGAPLDELPTVLNEVEPEPKEVSLADVLDLTEVEEEVPTLLFESPEEAETEPVSEFEVPEDPDEAMAWLEQLAAQQGASLDELPTVTDYDAGMKTAVVEEMDSSETPTVIDLPTDEVTEAEPEEAGLDIPDDPDEAMAWLEQLAARQGADLAELPTVDVVPEMTTPVTSFVPEVEEVEMPSEPEAVAEPEGDSEFEEALADLSDIDMPEDDDEALAWLAALTGETAEAEEEPDAYDDMPEPVESYEAVEVEEVEAVETFELPSADIEEFEADSFLDSIGEESDLFLETPADLPEVTDSEFADEELDSALPDWLQFGPTGDTSREELDWLESFGESDVDSWLEAEEQVTQYDLQSISDSAEPEPVAVPEPELLFDTGPLDETKAPVIEEFEVESLPSGPVDENELESARSALEIGDFNSALERYSALLHSGQGLPMLIADLETASTRHTKIAPLQRLLGDAYMQNGQLQKAIDTYRRALDNL